MNDPRIELSKEEHEEFCQQTTELESIHQEQEYLKNQGKLDSAEKERLDARMQKISERIEKQVDAQIATALASYVPPKTYVLPKNIKVILLVLASFVIIGAALEIYIGSRFIFSSTNEYRSLRYLLILLFLPIFGYGWYSFERKVKKHGAINPSFLLKCIVLFPLSFLISSGMVVMSPLGWVALSGWVTGRHMEYLQGNIVSIGKVNPESYSCKQSAQIEHNGCEVTICLDGLVKNSILKPGSTVTLAGRQSKLGLYVERIEEK